MLLCGTINTLKMRQGTDTSMHLDLFYLCKHNKYLLGLYTSVYVFFYGERTELSSTVQIDRRSNSIRIDIKYACVVN